MKRKKVSFQATKKIPQRKRVSFGAKGECVSFWATKKVSKKVKVKFYAKPKKLPKGTASRALR